MRKWLIEKLGGFPTVEAALAHIRETDDDAKHDVLRMAVRDLFFGISPDEILHFDNENGYHTFMGRPLSVEQMRELQAQALQLKSMKLWPILRYDVRYRLSQKMFEEGRVKEDFLWGQLATFLWDILKTRIDELSRMKF